MHLSRRLSTKSLMSINVYKFFSKDPNTSHVLTMGITIGGQNAGTVEIELFGRVVPKTAQNFYQLCDRNAVVAPGTDASLSGSYVGAPFHRVIPNFMIQGGDFTRGDGNLHHFLFNSFSIAMVKW